MILRYLPSGTRSLDTTGRPSCTHRFFDDELWSRRVRQAGGLVGLLLGACVHSAHEDPPAPASVERDSHPGPGLEVPGTFSRVGSCGGESGDEVFLTLLPDGVFTLRQMYRDSGCAPVISLVYIGRWSIAGDGHHVRLDNGPTWLRRLTILNPRTLSIPEQPATAAPSPPVYQTSSPSRLVPFRDPFRLRGVVGFAPLSQ